MTDSTSRDDSPAAGASAGRFAYEGLERVIHEKARLGILASLATHPAGLLFPDLKELCLLTDGNLSRHLTVLHEAGLVDLVKSVKRNRPQTLCSLTAEGRKRFHDYINVLESIIADASRVARPEEASPPLGLRAEGWA
jgi:DNA-binding MarR family transcriptional regulator